MDDVMLRDIFLSHRKSDKSFVRKLAATIESEQYQGRQLLCWLDEAEIRPGQSIPALINMGLEDSRFIALVMTPDYFNSESGWTDAEWHSALHGDPDNRTAKIIPLLVEDCPYIPFLLRHLKSIDFRGDGFGNGVRELLSVLREEPLPRPVAYRGQLLAPGGKINRATLLSERAVPQSDPDVISERLYCNLLPVHRLPQYIYFSPVNDGIMERRVDGSTIKPSKQFVKDAIRTSQIEAGVENPFMPAFRLFEGRIVTFHDLETLNNNPFSNIVDEEDIERIPTIDLLQDEDERKLVISLLNMAIDRHMHRRGLEIDNEKHGRFFFPPVDGKENVIFWTPYKRKAKRTVAKPCMKDEKIQFWRHQGAYIRMIFLANKLYLRIRPTWVITNDGLEVQSGPNVGRLVIRWTGPERNLHLLYHIRFWTETLRHGRGPISIWTGDQTLELSTIPAWVQQAYGIQGDYRDLMRALDAEADALAELEDQQADSAISEGLTTGLINILDEDDVDEGDDEEILEDSEVGEDD